jgi:hypothetical protein
MYVNMQVYLEACEESYQEFVSHVEGLGSIHEECLQRWCYLHNSFFLWQ